MINWPGNDYDAENIIDQPAAEQARILAERNGWRWGSCTGANRGPAPPGRRRGGLPGLRLLPEVMHTADGLSMFPYIRESRRIVALERVLEQDIVAELRPQGRAKIFETSVGLGWYPIDIHNCAGRVPSAGGHPTGPFQIPLGALIPRHMQNLIAACKNIGTTHITNGAYRLHPVEWNIGESAGSLAAFCLKHSSTPRQVWQSRQSQDSLLRQFQAHLVQQGIPLVWSPNTKFVMRGICMKHRSVFGWILVIFTAAGFNVQRVFAKRPSRGKYAIPPPCQPWWLRLN